MVYMTSFVTKAEGIKAAYKFYMENSAGEHALYEVSDEAGSTMMFNWSSVAGVLVTEGDVEEQTQQPALPPTPDMRDAAKKAIEEFENAGVQ